VFFGLEEKRVDKESVKNSPMERKPQRESGCPRGRRKELAIRESFDFPSIAAHFYASTLYSNAR
jgi:hypothetical protein